jgi:hypothetical protein
MPTHNIEEYAHVLIVEGYSDLLFYAEALEWLKNPSGVFIQHLGGSGNFRRKKHKLMKSMLEALLSPRLLANKTAIGVIVDADTDAAATSQRLEAVLSTITGQPVITGAWTPGPPRIGLFVVPGGGRQGEIETLVWEAWSNDPANAGPKTCIDSYLTCMAGHGRTAHSPDKGRIGALLSVLSDEDPRLGPGARDQVFAFARPELQPLLDFLRPLVTP